MMYIPPNVEKVSMWENTFQGEFSAALIPQPTKVVYLGKNNLTGSVEIENLSNNLLFLSVFENRLSGTLNFEKLPSSLVALDVFDNKLSGSLDLGGLDKILWIDIDDNISDEVWDGDDIDVNRIHIDFRKNLFEGDVFVQDLDRVTDFLMFTENHIESVGDASGNTRKASEFPE